MNMILCAGLLAMLAGCATTSSAKHAAAPATEAKAAPAKKAKRPESEYVTASILIPGKKPEQLWPMLAKVEDWGAWNGKITQVQPGAGLSPGAQIAWQYDEKDIVSSVVSVKENVELAFRGSASSKKAVLRWTLQPRGEDSSVTLRGELPYGAADEIRSRLGKEISEWLEAFKAANS